MSARTRQSIRMAGVARSVPFAALREDQTGHSIFGSGHEGHKGGETVFSFLTMHAKTGILA
jgi:hypothetical protein